MSYNCSCKQLSNGEIKREFVVEIFSKEIPSDEELICYCDNGHWDISKRRDFGGIVQKHKDPNRENVTIARVKVWID